MRITIFNDMELHLKENKIHEFLLSNKEVAKGYGIQLHTLATHKSDHKDELIEGKHWLKLEIETKGGKQKVIHWTKKGIVRLGFFIKSKKAREFRDWAEDYIIKSEEPIVTKDNKIEELRHMIYNMSNTLEKIEKNTRVQNQNIIIDPKKSKSLDDAKTMFKVSKTNKNDELKDKEKFYQDILKVIVNHPDGASQRTLLEEAGYSQSDKTRRWLQEQISILWDMTIIPGKCYKYTLR